MGESKKQSHISTVPEQPLEDRALKLAAQFFGQEMLPMLGVKGRILRVAPTEQIHLEMKQFLEDFNFEMEDGTWRHFEFESDSISTDDLRRFRAYEAVTSFYYGVEVYTYVLCTSKVKEIKRSLRQGKSVYRVHVIRLKDYNADEILRKNEKIQKRRRLRRKELIWLLLTPLMEGKTTQAYRIEKCLEMLKQERDFFSKEDLHRMESILYTFAVKFTSGEELKRIKEVLNMTVLGQMLVDDGIAIGITRGITQGITQGVESVAVNLMDLLDDRTISERTGLSMERVAELRASVKK